ncbi:PQQ-dependent sugar dehydrogenase [Castellaniella defragrans]|uniref:Glucose/arabinose dehydrogenase n=1 Tax=Castellaniella defragrans TaxID=75697 RepID=A0A7W9WP60_CASDE|nr:PQQ-dependent sugar dehydrogenase [Castellaniella defragrans]KAB0622438.1 PQQ-dependent sugar dehydrogenase [Castellaniella defragrans]MBB6083465.1 glucose/arabinose dehydrogenase [Castellaniella defragrans]
MTRFSALPAALALAALLAAAAPAARCAAPQGAGLRGTAPESASPDQAASKSAAPENAAPENAAAQNAGPLPAQADAPFAVRRIAAFDRPWAIAFLPDGRLVLTEKAGRMFLVTQAGAKTAIDGVPAAYDRGQNGMLDVAPSPDFTRDRLLYFTRVAPEKGGGALILARARLDESGGRARLSELTTLWRQRPASRGGQPGGIIAFSPDGRHLFLTVGDRMEPDTAQDPEAARGKILRLNPDGSAPPDNPMAEQAGIRALTWSTGHRNAYGLAFAPDGTLWEHEMGPRGGDELNRIRPGGNYGWPEVSNGDQYSGWPIPRHATRPEFDAPSLYWTPVIAPAGLAFYRGTAFPAWQGSALIGGLRAEGLVRVAFGKDGIPRQADRWSLDRRIRDVAVAADGAVWLIEDGSGAGLLRLTAK